MEAQARNWMPEAKDMRDKLTEAERQNLAEYSIRLHRSLNARYPEYDKPKKEHWENGRRWLEVVRKRIHSLRKPYDKRIRDDFFRRIPVCLSGSIYVDTLCIGLATSILSRYANESLKAKHEKTGQNRPLKVAS